MPLYRRLPKRGFKNNIKKWYGNFKFINDPKITDQSKDLTSSLDIKTLKEKIINKRFMKLKILGSEKLKAILISQLILLQNKL